MASLWRNKLYHSLSVQHLAHNIRAGYQSQNKFWRVCVYIKKLTDKVRNATAWDAFQDLFMTVITEMQKNVANTDTKL